MKPGPRLIQRLQKKSFTYEFLFDSNYILYFQHPLRSSDHFKYRVLEEGNWLVSLI